MRGVEIHLSIYIGRIEITPTHKTTFFIINSVAQHFYFFTNGYFTKDSAKIKAVAERLLLSGVNEILLSVDAFHQETIPLEPVMTFAYEVKKRKIGLKLSPAWLVSREDDNPYNQKTREILASFEKEGFAVGEGNIIFP